MLNKNEGHIALALEEDTDTARRLGERAVELGRTFGAPELEMLGLGLAGRALVSEGALEEGMRRLDEATTVALAGEAKLLYRVAWACCYLVSGASEFGTTNAPWSATPPRGWASCAGGRIEFVKQKTGRTRPAR